MSNIVVGSRVTVCDNGLGKNSAMYEYLQSYKGKVGTVHRIYSPFALPETKSQYEVAIIDFDGEATRTEIRLDLISLAEP